MNTDGCLHNWSVEGNVRTCRGCDRQERLRGNKWVNVLQIQFEEMILQLKEMVQQTEREGDLDMRNQILNFLKKGFDG